MYLWKIKSLAKQLGTSQMSEVLGLYYFLASTLLVLFEIYYALWWGTVRDWLFYFEFIVLCLITVVGCYKAFEANGGHEGKSFVLKAICLSVPAGIRVNVYSILVGLGLYFSSGNLFSHTTFADPLRAYTLISYAYFVGFNIYFWWLLISGIKETRNYEL